MKVLETRIVILDKPEHSSVRADIYFVCERGQIYRLGTNNNAGVKMEREMEIPTEYYEED